MHALVTNGDGTFDLKQVPIPTPGPNDVLVKVAAIAQNPTDWKTALLHQRKGNILGCDFAGTVVGIGSNVEPGLRKIGERIAAIVHGGVSPNGAFAEYVVTDATIAIPIPDDMSFEIAAQLPVACYTTCQCLYQCLNLPTPLEPTKEPIDVLVWSGTSATGQYAVQFAKAAGLRVISTASARNIEFVKSLGADEVFDYADSHTPRKIFAATGGKLRHVVDCISEGRTPNQCSMSLSKEGGTITTLLPYTSRSKGVKTDFVLAYSIFGNPVEFPFVFPASEEHHKNAGQYAKLIAEVIAKIPIKSIPVNIFPNGLLSVADGFEYMKAGKVHAEKITYRIADTPGLSSA
ncbi:dehydrogenase [Wolfiporia cocos MD-104 SS10]|uniref:Dehydrogenase n=1 Tax=Wolfiporia cocos (strain MD-104) TaxID=742152 RepID=A0A2H3IVH0_WOLCO|nr:dehydrogenase [Wolfiporia cocos MD-104 SS10]